MCGSITVNVHLRPNVSSDEHTHLTYIFPINNL